MNNIPPAPAPHNTSAQVKGFIHLNDKQLEVLRQEFNLKMPAALLRHIRKSFMTEAKRNITYDELYFLDGYFASIAPVAATVGELFTDSQIIAATYADLMAKKEAVDPANSPAALTELAQIAGRYLEYSGKKSSLHKTAAVRAGEDSALRIIMSGAIPSALTPDGAVGAYKKIFSGTAVAGDILIMIIPADEMPRVEFERAMARTIFSPEAVALHRSQIIEKYGLAYTASSFGGAYINLPSVPGVTDPCALSCLYEMCCGDVLAAADPLGAQGFLDALKNEGIPGIVIGSITSDKKLTVKYNSGAPASFMMSLLTHLHDLPGKRYLAAVPSREISEPGDEKPGEALYCSRVFDPSEGLLIASLKISGTEYRRRPPFFLALDSVLTATAQCVAGGAEFTEVALSLSAEFPPFASSPQAHGDALSLILGVYRAQIEYYMPDEMSRYFYDSDEPSLTVTAAAKPQGRPTPALFNRPGSEVYLLAPRFGEDGLPDFEDLRRMWKYVAAVCRDGSAASALALGFGGAKEAIRAASTSIIFQKEDKIDDSLLSLPAPGGFIIESKVRLKGVLIGHTAPIGGSMRM